MSDFVILNGFDRSGTSAISRTLANHPDIEIIMQPFNSGFLRRRMYEALDESDPTDEAHVFFRDLKQNRLNLSLIKSEWHYKFSSVQEYAPGKIHIVKTTINHMAQRWMNDYYPGIDVWGIWRNPYEIVSSVLANAFHDKWYNNALQEIWPTVKSEPVLNAYLPFFSTYTGEAQEVALLVAVRTHFFLTYLDADKLLSYEQFCRDANNAFNDFSRRYSLSRFDFNDVAGKDLNIIGNAYDRNVRRNDALESDHALKDIFAPLLALYNEKFGNG